ncbi:cytochrome P450 [Gonapodya prolifera JEL478]|uniref:Cytochrome P450 n=1 Tax=Gonapodya prolifera (strain JEL478) TaxID=1344416 RepID=A0A139AEM5_GONPJ|nr:cytochrome P450 [Gonapodya prolifera JEL478]|eukprot:KXS15272.1 cytochrome P450 [Gonapodya prolifera JEL478]
MDTIFNLAVAAFVVYATYIVISLWGRNPDDAARVLSVPLLVFPKAGQLHKTPLTILQILRNRGRIVRVVNILRPTNSVVFIADPHALRELYLGKNWERFPRANSTHPSQKYSRILVDGVSVQNGEEWKMGRLFHARTFAATAVRGYLPILESNLHELMQKLEFLGEQGSFELDLKPVFRRYAFDIVSRLVFGEDICSQREGSEGEKSFNAWDNALQTWGTLQFLYSVTGSDTLIWLTGLRDRFEASLAPLKRVVRQAMDRVRVRRQDRFSIYDNIEQSSKKPEWLCEPENELKQLLTFIIAGHDPVTSVLSFALCELATRPDIQRRLRAETDTSCGVNGVLALEKLEGCKVRAFVQNLAPPPSRKESRSSMQLLNSVIKETLRHYSPAANGIPRVIAGDWTCTWIDDTGIPRHLSLRKGDLVFGAIYATHHLDANWPGTKSSLDTFDPERFLDDPNGGAKLHSFIPFGDGPRRCIGERLALQEIRLAIAALVRKYDFAPAEGFSCDWKGSAPMMPLHVKLRISPVKAT